MLSLCTTGHIFFDDAFEKKIKKFGDEAHKVTQVNKYVKLLVNVMDESASDVHKINIEIEAPIKMKTPYGGRLVYTLPGRNKLYVHLKDNEYIRKKKRWSQVVTPANPNLQQNNMSCVRR